MSAFPKRDNVWNLAEARDRLGEVVDRTISEGRQEIHRRDDVVVVIRKEDLDKLEDGKKRPDFKEHLLAFPKDESGEPSLTEIILEGRRWFNESDN